MMKVPKTSDSIYLSLRKGTIKYVALLIALLCVALAFHKSSSAKRIEVMKPVELTGGSTEQMESTDAGAANSQHPNQSHPQPPDSILVPCSKHCSYEAKRRWLQPGRVLHWSFFYHDDDDGKATQPSRLTWAQALHLWQYDQEFQLLTTRTIRESPFTGLFWECPAISDRDDLEKREFEFVVVDGYPAMASPDEHSFQAQFEEEGGSCLVVDFKNLSGDAHLVVPCPQDGVPNSAYTHVAAFMRGEGEGGAPQQQVQKLWETIGKVMSGRLQEVGGSPVWLSTAGQGVYWTHVRLDSVPKYYKHAQYRRYQGNGSMDQE